ncbi:MAG TPA: amidohydrolase [Thermoanaerobaculia bacterium]|nr:amidohydrolase [Thermoanaerobaculia bacterium]
MRIVRTILAISFLPLLACGTSKSTNDRMTDETIFTASTIVEGADQTPRHDRAIYVAGGTIRETGSAADIRRAHPNARVVDAPRATILPGLTDAHAHLYGLGLALDVVNLTGTTSVDDSVGRVRERVATATPNDWVQGRGWDQNDWPVKEFPTAAMLDAVATDHPLWLKRVDGHAGWANAAALRAAGVTAATADPEGGRIIRNERGEPTGVFVDNAMDVVEKVIPAPSFDLRKRRVLAAAQDIARNGLTEMHDAGANAETIRAVRELIDEKRFPIRVYTMVSDEPELLKEWFARGPLIGYGGRLTVRSVKMYADGALGSRGAAMLAPYNDEPSNSGLMLATIEHMADVAKRAKAAGFQANTHAIGDRGVDNVIDAYERSGVAPADRFRIEHFQVVAPQDFARVAHDGIIASMQPTHATSDMRWAERRVGAERIKGAYAWRTVLNSGARLALGSDFAVEDVNPWFGI